MVVPSNTRTFHFRLAQLQGVSIAACLSVLFGSLLHDHISRSVIVAAHRRSVYYACLIPNIRVVPTLRPEVRSRPPAQGRPHCVLSWRLCRFVGMQSSSCVVIVVAHAVYLRANPCGPTGQCCGTEELPRHSARGVLASSQGERIPGDTVPQAANTYLSVVRLEGKEHKQGIKSA